MEEQAKVTSTMKDIKTTLDRSIAALEGITRVLNSLVNTLPENDLAPPSEALIRGVLAEAANALLKRMVKKSEPEPEPEPAKTVQRKRTVPNVTRQQALEHTKAIYPFAAPLIKKGVSFRKLAAALNEAGYRTITGYDFGAWTASALCAKFRKYGLL